MPSAVVLLLKPLELLHCVVQVSHQRLSTFVFSSATRQREEETDQVTSFSFLDEVSMYIELSESKPTVFLPQ